jgi:lectin-like protein
MGAQPSAAPVDGDAGLLAQSDAAADGGDAGAAPVLPDAALTDCPDGVIEAGSCYRAVAAPLAWMEARDSCVAWGGDLVSVDTPVEDAFVGGLLGVSIWLGASDIAADNVFAWANGRPLGFANWGASQPDAYPGPDCVEKREELDEPWYDQPCSSLNAYVCERPLQ